jgi:hypothetical protein
MDISVFDVIGDFAIALATVALTVVGAWLTHNYSRRMRFELAEARRTAYAGLWEITGRAAPTRLDTAGLEGALTKAQRQSLYQALTDWYYNEGAGMLLENTTRNVYLKAKNNLVCAIKQFDPEDALTLLQEDLSVEDEEVARGVLSIRQLSLLRTQLKSDLAIYGQTYTKELARHERRFLEACGVDLGAEPWRRVEPEDRIERVERKAEAGQPLGVPTQPSKAGGEEEADPLRALWRLVESWRRGGDR